jgi:sec-independent protein translocase protein TatB
VFDSIGWGELLVVALAALFIFGPERLPTLAKDAAAGLKKVRAAISDVRGQVDETLGDDLAGLRNVDLRKYHPRTFIRDQLFGDEEDQAPLAGRGSANGSAGLAGSGVGTTVAGPDVVRPRDRATPPPFDFDAT